MNIVKVSKFETCNFCSSPAHYDAPVRGHGTWAFFCEDCYASRGSHSMGTRFELMNDVEAAHASSGPEAYDASLEASYMDQLDIEDVMRESLFGDSCGVECADGCMTEPDGKCPHGYSSPLLLAGLI